MPDIIQSNNIIDVLDHATKKTLVLFDIDNTLVESVQDFGGTAWFLALVKNFEQRGLSQKEAMKKSSDMFSYLQQDVLLKPVELATIKVLDYLQRKKIKTMALTARWKALAESTHKDLLALNITFPNSLYADELVLGEISKVYKGIIFTGDERSKGETLLSFFEKIEYVPEHVVFVDDSMHQVKNVHQTLSAKNIPCVCIRYGATDARSASFDFALAENELQKVVGVERYKKMWGEL